MGPSSIFGHQDCCGISAGGHPKCVTTVIVIFECTLEGRTHLLLDIQEIHQTWKASHTKTFRFLYILVILSIVYSQIHLVIISSTFMISIFHFP